MFIVKKRLYFCAAHRLCSSALSEAENNKIYGKCNSPNYHGHNYEVEIAIKGEIDPKTGMVINFCEIADIVEREVIERWDHKNLNLDVPELAGVIPTAENLSKKIWEIVDGKITKGRLYSVTVNEKDTNIVTYFGEEAKELDK